MAAPRIKGKSALWGVGSIYGSTILLSVRRKDGGEIDWLLDNNGFKIGKIYYDDHTEVAITIIMESGTTLPVRGDTITVTSAGGTIAGLLLCDDTEIMWEQKGWTKLTINATANVNLTTA